MSMSFDGPGPCVKCQSWSVTSDDNGDEYCRSCGTYQVKYHSEQMIGNLLKYGFKEVKRYEKPTFAEKLFNVTPKQLESYYKYGSVIAKHIDAQSNMTLVISKSKEVNFHHYGSFPYVKESLDKILNTKKIQRRLKLEQLKKHLNE